MNRIAIGLAAAALVAASACAQKKDAPAADGKDVKVAAKPAAAELPPLNAGQRAQAKLLVRDNCLACHSGEMLEQQRLTPAQWTANVKKMQGWGAAIDAEELPLVAAYLAQGQGLDAGPYTVASANGAVVEAEIAPLPDGPFKGGDPKRGASVWTSSCASCHGADAKGALAGINLVDRPVLYRAAEFAEVVKKGRNKMPEAPTVQDLDIAALLAYLRTLRG